MSLDLSHAIRQQYCHLSSILAAANISLNSTATAPPTQAPEGPRFNFGLYTVLLVVPMIVTFLLIWKERIATESQAIRRVPTVNKRQRVEEDHYQAPMPTVIYTGAEGHWSDEEGDWLHGSFREIGSHNERLIIKSHTLTVPDNNISQEQVLKKRKEMIENDLVNFYFSKIRQGGKASENFFPAQIFLPIDVEEWKHKYNVRPRKSSKQGTLIKRQSTLPEIEKPAPENSSAGSVKSDHLSICEHDYDHEGICGEEPSREKGSNARILSSGSDDSTLAGIMLEKTGE